ncbi:hypothetical protein [Halorhabdus rudnickae]|uniref:hypothetical protein n=1 Tax=Halorhabdus rudnickae TaxID=1775544 RepID=UPI001082D338|nr:hypothetical protein [Halorhabdus rudnickae]
MGIQTTVHLEPHQVAFFHLREDINRSGAIRRLLDAYIEDTASVDLDDLEAASKQLQKDPSRDFEDAIDDIESVGELVNQENLIEQ